MEDNYEKLDLENKVYYSEYRNEKDKENSNKYYSGQPELSNLPSPTTPYKTISDSPYLWKGYSDNCSNNLSGTDSELLDKLLSGEDSIVRKETIEELIKKREELKNKKIEELNHIKGRLRNDRIRCLYSYNQSPALMKEFQDLNKQYHMMNELTAEEEIKSWKDIMFLQMRLLEEDVGGLLPDKNGTAKENEK